MNKIYDSFDLRAKVPLEKRSVVTALSDIDTSYEGLLSYQKSDKKFYFFDDNLQTKGLFDDITDYFTNLLNTSVSSKVSKNTIFYNVDDFGAIGNGTADDTAAIQNCINTASTNHGTVLFMPKTYKITSSLTIPTSFVTLSGTGGKTEQTIIDVHISSGFAFHVTSAYGYKICNMTVNMNNSAGGAIFLDAGAGHEISNMVVRGSTISDSDVIKITSGAIIFDNNNISVLNSSARALNCYGTTAQVNINSRFTRNTVSGTGLGFLIDADDNTRCEGMMITDNVFLNSGNEQLTITKVLYAHVCNNVFDNGGQYNIWFVPKDLGVRGVIVSNNYIATASATQTGIGIQFTNNGTFGTDKILISNNCFMYSGYGIVCSSQYINGVLIDGNTFSDMYHEGINVHGTKNVIIKNNLCMDTTTYSITLSDDTNGGKFIVKDNYFNGLNIITKTDSTKFIISDNIGIANITSAPTIVSNTFSATTTATQTCVIPHGLGTTPTITKCFLNVLQNGSGAEFGGAWIVSTDATNITCQVKVTFAGTGQGKCNVLIEP